jgi:DNA polymerase-3 subunit epsilon
MLSPPLDVPFAAQRALVVDVESSGLDPYADCLISIGAIEVSDGVIRLDSAFEVVLRQERSSAEENILVHHIGGSAQLAGRDPVDGLLDFLSCAGKVPLVAFRADFDRVLIGRAMKAVLGVKLANHWLDLALIAPAVLGGQVRASLDDWLLRCGIENYDRHDALADALATAQLMLVVLAAAKDQGIGTWAGLAGIQQDRRWLERAGPLD